MHSDTWHTICMSWHGHRGKSQSEMRVQIVSLSVCQIVIDLAMNTSAAIFGYTLCQLMNNRKSINFKLAENALTFHSNCPPSRFSFSQCISAAANWISLALFANILLHVLFNCLGHIWDWQLMKFKLSIIILNLNWACHLPRAALALLCLCAWFSIIAKSFIYCAFYDYLFRHGSATAASFNIASYMVISD